jgi:hypothetical protein
MFAPAAPWAFAFEVIHEDRYCICGGHLHNEQRVSRLGRRRPMTDTLFAPPDAHRLIDQRPTEGPARNTTPEAPAAFRLQANMRRGTGSSVSATWRAYSSIDRAREAARDALRDDRVLRITVVADTVPPRFVEWVNR